MGMYLHEMSLAQIELAAERWSDHMYDLYYGPETEEPWERDNPDWQDIAELVDEQSWDWTSDAIREYIEGDGDIMMEIYEAGLLAQYINPAANMEDPDDEWAEVDRVMTTQWNNNELMNAIYLWLPEEHQRKMCEQLLKAADSNGIREIYNKQHEGDDIGMEEDD